MTLPHPPPVKIVEHLKVPAGPTSDSTAVTTPISQLSRVESEPNSPMAATSPAPQESNVMGRAFGGIPKAPAPTFVSPVARNVNVNMARSQERLSPPATFIVDSPKAGGGDAPAEPVRVSWSGRPVNLKQDCAPVRDVVHMVNCKLA